MWDSPVEMRGFLKVWHKMAAQKRFHWRLNNVLSALTLLLKVTLCMMLLATAVFIFWSSSSWSCNLALQMIFLKSNCLYVILCCCNWWKENSTFFMQMTVCWLLDFAQIHPLRKDTSSASEYRAFSDFWPTV